MADIYSGAHVVIAANWSDDCNKGCFHVRQSRPAVTIDLPGGLNAVHATLLFQSDQSVIHYDGYEFRGEPLSTRGWAFQERVLAKRVIHYNSRQMYFECAAGLIAEDGSYTERVRDDVPGLRYSSVYTGTFSRKPPQIWWSLLPQYAGRNLTKPTDKLPAMSGLARLMQTKTNAVYVAGLWSDSLLAGLCWKPWGRRRNPASRDEYIGPSWSWASCDADSINSPDPTFVSLGHSEILDWHVDLKHAENPFGEVSGAWMRIRGPVVPLRPNPRKTRTSEQDAPLYEDAPYEYVCTPYSKDEFLDTLLELDYEDDISSGEWRGWDLQILLLCSCPVDDPHDHPLSFGLVIRSEGTGHAAKIRRVGTATMDRREADKVGEDKNNWKTIILV